MVQQTRFDLFRLQWRTWWKWHKILSDFLLRWFLYIWMSPSKLIAFRVCVKYLPWRPVVVWLWYTYRGASWWCGCGILTVAPRGGVVVVYLPWRLVVVWLWCTYRGAPWWCFVQVTQVLQSPDVVREECGVNTELMRWSDVKRDGIRAHAPETRTQVPEC